MHRGHLDLAILFFAETDPQMLERWGCADEIHLGKYIRAKDFGLEFGVTCNSLREIHRLEISFTFSSNWVIPYRGGCSQFLISSRKCDSSIFDWKYEFSILGGNITSFNNSSDVSEEYGSLLSTLSLDTIAGGWSEWSISVEDVMGVEVGKLEEELDNQEPRLWQISVLHCIRIPFFEWDVVFDRWSIHISVFIAELSWR